MAELIKRLRGTTDTSSARSFNFRVFIQENLTRSPWLLAWVVIFTLFMLSYTSGRLQAAPVTTLIVLALWFGSLGWMAVNELNKSHNSITQWLKDNLYSSITNALVTLFLVLLIIWAVESFWSYAVTNASFSQDGAIAKEETGAGRRGARWGSVTQNFWNLLVFRMKDEIYRVWASLGTMVALVAASTFVYRGEQFRGTNIRRGLNFLWLLSPLVLFYFLRGYGESGPFYEVDIDQIWGGLLLSVLAAAFGIVVSFPFGVLLALGRRSEVYGVPAWLTYSVAAIVTIWGLLNSTPTGLEEARGTLGTILAYWPLAVPLVAYLFQRSFKGNVLAGACTVYIECIRGVPFITLLFMSIVLFPIFLPPGFEVGSVVRVFVAFAMFSAAYLAENVRGGLQAIPRGQYEAADSLGLSTYHKYQKIVLPQAIRLVIPAIVGQFIGMFKDTSLVFLVGLFDFLNVANGIASQPNWVTVRTEPYIFLFFVYFLISSLMAWYSRRLEARLAVGQR